jgi:hypothetical protein
MVDTMSIFAVDDRVPNPIVGMEKRKNAGVRTLRLPPLVQGEIVEVQQLAVKVRALDKKGPPRREFTEVPTLSSVLSQSHTVFYGWHGG